jgi:hypothetical protein
VATAALISGKQHLRLLMRVLCEAAFGSDSRAHAVGFPIPEFHIHDGPIVYIRTGSSSANRRLIFWTTVSRVSPPLPPPSNGKKEKRRAVVERLAAAHLATMQGTLAETVGESNRQRLVWLSLLAMPLLFPVALPGMSSAVGGFCLLTAYGICVGRSVPLPAWLAKRKLDGRIKALLTAMVSRVIHIISWAGRPRLLSLTRPSARVFNALMLSAAGLSMMMPVPIISFDNVLPALAIVLIAWGLRLRDGLMLLAGYLVSLAAVGSVALLLWGGTHIVTELLSRVGFAFSP